MIYPGPILLPAASSGGGGGVTKGFIRTITGTPGAGSTNTGLFDLTMLLETIQTLL